MVEKPTHPEALPLKIERAAASMIEAVEPWYEDQRAANGEVKTNVMCAGLYVSEALAGHFPLKSSHYLTKSQVKGAGGRKIRSILADHDEERTFTKEGGRTSRATVDHARQVAALFNQSGTEASVEDFSDLERRTLAFVVQQWFVKRVAEDFFSKEKISVVIDPSWSVSAVLAVVLEAGRQRGGNAAGAVAQHLVGAKLQIRFPDAKINIESYTTADQQTGRAGDYQIGDTAIHVTMSPGENVFHQRCVDNIQQGFRPRVLVPEDRLPHAHVHAEDAGLSRQVAIQSIEDFVGTNIEEVAGFSQVGVRSKLRQLLELYNQRIEAAEADVSLKVTIPENL